VEKRRGEKPPNKDEIAAPVEEALSRRGWLASKSQIKKIALESEFEGYRWPGRRPKKVP
jgi:hypothetical protein